MIDEVNTILRRADCSSIEELEDCIIKFQAKFDVSKQKQQPSEMNKWSKMLETRKKWLQEIAGRYFSN